jgi:hypothetical protein
MGHCPSRRRTPQLSPSHPRLGSTCRGTRRVPLREPQPGRLGHTGGLAAIAKLQKRRICRMGANTSTPQSHFTPALAIRPSPPPRATLPGRRTDCRISLPTPHSTSTLRPSPAAANVCALRAAPHAPLQMRRSAPERARRRIPPLPVLASRSADGWPIGRRTSTPLVFVAKSRAICTMVNMQDIKQQHLAPPVAHFPLPRHPLAAPRVRPSRTPPRRRKGKRRTHFR